MIEKLKSEGRQRDISKEIAKFNKEYKEQNPSIPNELAYVEDDDFKDYIHDMDMVQRHAVCNRAEIEMPWQKEKHSGVEDLYEQDDFDLEM